ncbi:MAG: tRNA uridine-5-carboxymethylaminomethyl(34) synthesis GTPase MnmE [Armatimonadetes bacterium]|nr:tRNA uridine-5-carboxymethylaminomethyl(34) synthesis GTPase MnmE [Armatimonadota bacterium]
MPDPLSRHTDTIVALMTPPGKSAVALIRLSGPNAHRIAASVFDGIPVEPEWRHAYYGSFVHGDDGLVTLFADGRSYTGEPVAELSTHGSMVSVRGLIEACLAQGARQAEPGEFTMRAWMNGEMDLAQAEGVREVIESGSERHLREGGRLLSGGFREVLAPITEETTRALTTVEALTDFSEEIGEIPLADRIAPIQRALEAVHKLRQTESATRALQHGVRVALAGRPNAGKSSLLNALLRQDRAIVTPIPGTTRDTISETIEIGGVAVHLTDTAGIRESEDLVERFGIERSRAALDDADLVLYLFDAALGWSEEDESLVASLGKPHLLLANKSDLANAETGLAISASEGEGLDLILEWLGNQVESITEEASFLVPRHYASLAEVEDSLQDAIATIQDPRVPDDLSAVHLRGALRHLGEISGESTTPDMVDLIFSQFCIGK